MTYSDEVLADTPLAYYRLGETSGTAMADSSGNGRNGSYVNSPTLGVTGLLSGDSNTAVGFDGTNWRRGSVSAAAWIQQPPTLTVEAIVKPSTISGNGQIAVRSNFGSISPSNYQFILTRRTNTYYAFFITDGGSFVEATTPTGLAAVGVTNHVVATFDGTTVRLFVDGMEKASAPLSGTLGDGGSQPITIGAANYSGGEFFNGVIDEVALYGAALSTARIQAHVAAMSAPTPTAPLNLVEALPPLQETLSLRTYVRTSTANALNGRRRSGYALVADNTDPVALPDDGTERRDKAFWYPTPTLVDGRPT